MTDPVIVVSGSRSFSGHPGPVVVAFVAALGRLADDGFDPTGGLVLHGDARGVDRIVGGWVQRTRFLGLTVEACPARWRPDGVYDPRAGLRRNVEMIDRADALIGIWDGASTGTAHAIDTARARGLRVVVEHPALVPHVTPRRDTARGRDPHRTPSA